MRPTRLVSIVQSFLKASSSSSRVQIRPLCSIRIIWFRNFSQHAARAYSTLKDFSCAVPCLFQSLDYFESLLLQLYRANPPCSGPLISKFHSLARHCHHPRVKRRCRNSTALQSRLATAIESQQPRIPRVTMALPQGPGTRHDGFARNSRR